MPLYVKDAQVDALVDQLMAIKQTTKKVDVVRDALRNEVNRVQGPDDLVEESVAFVEELLKRAGPDAMPIDGTFLHRLFTRD